MRNPVTMSCDWSIGPCVGGGQIYRLTISEERLEIGFLGFVFLRVERESIASIVITEGRWLCEAVIRRDARWTPVVEVATWAKNDLPSALHALGYTELMS